MNRLTSDADGVSVRRLCRVPAVPCAPPARRVPASVVQCVRRWDRRRWDGHGRAAWALAAGDAAAWRVARRGVRHDM